MRQMEYEAKKTALKNRKNHAMSTNGNKTALHELMKIQRTKLSTYQQLMYVSSLRSNSTLSCSNVKTPLAGFWFATAAAC